MGKQESRSIGVDLTFLVGLAAAGSLLLACAETTSDPPAQRPAGGAGVAGGNVTVAAPVTTPPQATAPDAPTVPTTPTVPAASPTTAPAPSPTEATATTTSPESDPRIPVGTLEDGTYLGYFRGEAAGSFIFDRADVANDGVWSNTSGALRELPVGDPLALNAGVAIEVVVAEQIVVSVRRLNRDPVIDVNPLLPPGTIEDGTHFGFVAGLGSRSFDFDRAVIESDGTWRNDNPALRELFMSQDLGFEVGARVGVDVVHQRVVRVWDAS